MPLSYLTIHHHKKPKTTTTKRVSFTGSGGAAARVVAKRIIIIMATTTLLLLASTKQRGSLGVVRAWMLRPATTTTTTASIQRRFLTTTTSYRRSLSSLASARNQFGPPSDYNDAGRPPKSYSLDDWQAAMVERDLPPSLFSNQQDEYGGAYTYQPELYEDDWINGPPGEYNDATLYPDDVKSQYPEVPEEFLTQAPVRDEDEDEDFTKTLKQSTTASSSHAVNADRSQSPSPDSRPDAEITKEEDVPSPFKGLEAVLSEAPQSRPTPPPPIEPPKRQAPPRSFPSSSSSYTHVAEAKIKDQAANDFWTKSAARGMATDDLDDLKHRQLPDLQRQIYQQNNNEEFNINSPQQISLVLFGVKGKSTNKDTLYGMAAAGNRMADLILQYRETAARIKRLERRATQKVQGTHVTSVSTVARVNKEHANTTAATTTETVMEAADPLLLLDASSFIFRAYHSMPPIHRSDGMPTGAVLGFCNMLNRLVLNRLLDGEQPRMILAFDSPGPSFRKAICADYKAHRPEAPMDLIPQFALIRQASAAFGVPIVEAKMFEADDVIATLAGQAHIQGLDVNILSGDKDLMQLVTGPTVEPCIHMIDPLSMSRITHKQVVEKWGVGPEKLGDLLALAGDSADNIPGVPGIGPKTASTLLDEYGNLENLLANAEKIKQKSRREKLIANAEQARMSRDLVELREDVQSVLNISGNLTEWRTEPLDTDRLFAFYDEMGFKDLRRRLQNSLQRGAPRKRPKSRSGKEKVEVPNPEDFADVPF